jgi:hypothetical protein
VENILQSQYGRVNLFKIKLFFFSEIGYAYICVYSSHDSLILFNDAISSAPG